MTDTTSGSRFAFLVPVRLYGPQVVKMAIADYGNGRKGEPEYSTRFFFPKDHPEVKAFSEALSTAKAGKFGKDAKGVAFPFQMGDAWADAWAKKNPGKEKNPRDFARGMILAKASSKNFPPMLSYVSGGNLVDIPDEARVASGGKFYSGVEALVEINLVAYDGNGQNIPNSIKAYLTKVCSLGRGDRLGGGSSASTFGKAVQSLGTVSDEDPTAGAEHDGDIPF